MNTVYRICVEVRRQILLATLFMIASAASAEWFKPGAYGIAGSAGYGKWALTADGGWKEDHFNPYFSSEFGTDNFERSFVLIGGASRDIQESLTGRAGAGFTLGRFKDDGSGASALNLELGLDHDLGPGSLGGQYRLTAGSIVSTTYAPGAIRSRQSVGLGRRPGAQSNSSGQSDNEFSVAYWWPLDRMSITFRETLSLLSYAGPIFTEAVTGEVPLGRDRQWSAWTTFSVDKGSNSGVYLEAGFSRLFK